MEEISISIYLFVFSLFFYVAPLSGEFPCKLQRATSPPSGCNSLEAVLVLVRLSRGYMRVLECSHIACYLRFSSKVFLATDRAEAIHLVLFFSWRIPSNNTAIVFLDGRSLV